MPVRRRGRSGAKRARFSAGEHVRVVPLHYPKAVVPLGAPPRARRTGGAGGAGRLPAPAAAPHLVYNGGPLLTSVQVFTVFWGRTWGTAAAVQLKNDLNAFFGDIVTSALVDQLGEYAVAGKPIGHGTYAGTATVGARAPAGSVTDTTIRARVRSWIAGRIVPKNTANTLYFVFLDPGVVSILGGSRSCQSFCGYHSNVGRVYYAVMPYPGCAGCLGGKSVFDALTATSSHELCEAITDPVPGSGWYDDVNGEIGDICSWSLKQVAGYTVQREWSNAQGRCV